MVFDRRSTSHGIDIVDVDEFSRICAADPAFIRRVLTTAEVDDCHGRTESLAGRFAAKEAVSKAMRVSLKDIDLLDVEILNDTNGAPVVSAQGQVESLLSRSRVSELGVSISHKGSCAVAIAWLVRDQEATGGRQ